MDESWGIWKYWVKWNSKYFFVTFLITKNSRTSQIALRNTEKWIIRKWLKVTWEFHANKESDKVRMKLLENSKWKDFIIVACYVDQVRYQWISSDPHLLYNNITSKLLKLCVDNNIFLKWESVELIISRRETNRFLNNQMINQIRDSLEWILDLKIRLAFSRQEKWLQHVDLFSYSIFQKYEFWNNKYYDMFWNNVKLIEEYKWHKTK